MQLTKSHSFFLQNQTLRILATQPEEDVLEHLSQSYIGASNNNKPPFFHRIIELLRPFQALVYLEYLENEDLFAPYFESHLAMDINTVQKLRKEIYNDSERTIDDVIGLVALETQELFLVEIISVLNKHCMHFIIRDMTKERGVRDLTLYPPVKTVW